MSAIAARFPRLRRLPGLGRLRPSSGITAIIVKELRGRMRGRRAFVILTLYVLLLAGFAWMSQQTNQALAGRSGSYDGITASYASATIGRAIFADLLMLQTLMVAVLAPTATAGAISSEREHQTLELLAVTPISSLAIVIGKLLSALAWVFVLVLASIPVTALVFVFGGVAPDDVLRGYAVLIATVIGLGAIGMFFSALTRRTGAATGLTMVVVLGLVLGSQYLFNFLSNTAKIGPNGLRETPPAAIVYLNPFVAQADVACGTQDGTTYTDYCALVSGVVGFGDQEFRPPQFDPSVPVPCCGAIDGGGVIKNVGNVGVDQVDISRRPAIVRIGGVAVDPNGDVSDGDVVVDSLSFRDRFWPKTVLSFLGLAIVLTLVSIQFVTPTRRLRPSLPGPVRRLIRRRSST